MIKSDSCLVQDSAETGWPGRQGDPVPRVAPHPLLVPSWQPPPLPGSEMPAPLCTWRAEGTHVLSLSGRPETHPHPTPRTRSCDHRQPTVGNWDVAVTPGPATRQMFHRCQRTVNKDREKSEWLPLLVPETPGTDPGPPSSCSFPRFRQRGARSEPRRPPAGGVR